MENLRFYATAENAFPSTRTAPQILINPPPMFPRRLQIPSVMSARSALMYWCIVSMIVGAYFLQSMKLEYSLLLEIQIIFFQSIMCIAILCRLAHFLKLLRRMIEIFLIVAFFGMAANLLITAIDVSVANICSEEPTFPNSILLQSLLLLSSVATVIQYFLINDAIEELQGLVDEMITFV